MESESEKEDDSKKSCSSNEDFEIIGSHVRISGHSTGSDGESNDPSINLSQKGVKRRAPMLPHNLQRERTIKSAILKCMPKVMNKEGHNEAQGKNDYSFILWKVLFVIIFGMITLQLQLFLKHRMFFMESAFGENEDRVKKLEETITRQQQMVEKLEKQLKRCASSDVHTLPVRIGEERATAFEKKDGFSYFFVIVDWKRNGQGIARQHLHLAFKQSNSSIYVYDHGSLSGKYFTVGDRIIDIDGITFIRAADLRDHILWSHRNKDYFTSIIERPATEQAAHVVSLLLQPSQSSFSVVLST